MLARLSPTLDRAAGRLAASASSVGLEPPAFAELDALRGAEPIRPEEIDLGALDKRPPFAAISAADDLRLPPPPVRAPDGEALFRRVSSAVDRFASADRTRGAPAGLEAEARAMSLLFGIRALQNEIRAQTIRHHAA